MLLKSWSSHLVWYAKKMKLSSLKAQTKQSQMLDVIYISALTLCAHLFYLRNLFVTIFTRFFFSLRCGQTTSDDAYAQMIKVRASLVSDVKERWTHLWLFLQTVVLCGEIKEGCVTIWPLLPHLVTNQPNTLTINTKTNWIYRSKRFKTKSLLAEENWAVSAAGACL